MSIEYVFKCPKCGHDKAEEYISCDEVKSTVKNIRFSSDGEAELDYENDTEVSGEVYGLRYQCAKCGNIVCHEPSRDPIDCPEDFASWCQVNGTRKVRMDMEL